MAKGKKGKKGKKKKKEVDPNALTEVDKTFYELTITDLNRKLARLRSLTTDLEQKNEELNNQLEKLDEDRNDIIIYLKRMLQDKSDEIKELQERLTALEEAKQDDTEQFQAKVADLENEYKQMHEQLTSEIKLLEGKLNSLEEFRIQRDELMKKFEDQENMIEEQEKRHRNELYDIERKFIIGKDKLKKDMEARLLSLSSDFHDATELRIAATTHRVIRENIAINNELDSMLTTHKRLYNENGEMKERDKTLRQEAQLHEAEKNKALAKMTVQIKIIERLTKEHRDMSQKLLDYKAMEQEMRQVFTESRNLKETIDNLNFKIRILEQNVHCSKCKENSLQTELQSFRNENDRLVNILNEAVCVIKDALAVRTGKVTDEALQVSRRENLLTQLFVLLSEAEVRRPTGSSLDTVSSISATYARGDLGFVPKPAHRSIIPTIRSIEAQVGTSFLEFIAVPESTSMIQKPEGSFHTTAEEHSEKSIPEIEEESDVFFDDEEEVEEESVREEEEEVVQDELDLLEKMNKAKSEMIMAKSKSRVAVQDKSKSKTNVEMQDNEENLDASKSKQDATVNVEISQEGGAAALSKSKSQTQNENN